MGIPFWSWALFGWLLVAALGGIFDGLGGISAGSHTDLNTVFSLQVIKMNEISVFGAFDFTIPTPNLEFFKAIGHFATFNFDMFNGLQLMRYSLLVILVGPFLFVLVTQIMPSIMSGLGFRRG